MSTCSKAKLLTEKGSSDSATFLSRVLQYLETPQYVCVWGGGMCVFVCEGDVYGVCVWGGMCVFVCGGYGVYVLDWEGPFSQCVACTHMSLGTSGNFCSLCTLI